MSSVGTSKIALLLSLLLLILLLLCVPVEAAPEGKLGKALGERKDLRSEKDSFFEPGSLGPSLNLSLV